MSYNSGNEEKINKTYQVGDEFISDTFKININNSDIIEQVGTAFLQQSPAEGGIYLAIKWDYTNISDKPVNDSNVKIMSNLNPDIKINDAVIFEISEEKFDKNTWKILIETDESILVNL